MPDTNQTSEDPPASSDDADQGAGAKSSKGDILKKCCSNACVPFKMCFSSAWKFLGFLTGRGGTDKMKEGRGCTDILMCIFFLLFCAGFFVVAILAFNVGDPDSLTYGMDHYGYRCGVVNYHAETGEAIDLTDRKKVFYPDLDSDIVTQLAANPGIQTTPWKFKPYGICLEECPEADDVSQSAPSPVPDYLIADDGTVSDDNAPAKNDGDPWFALLSTRSVLNRCMPVENVTANNNNFCAYPACQPTDPDDLYPPAVDRPCAAVPGSAVDYAWDIDAQCPCEDESDDCSLADRLDYCFEMKGLKCQKVLEQVNELQFTSAQSGRISGMLAGATAEFDAFMRSLTESKYIICGVGGGMSLVVGFIWLMLVGKFAYTAVWGSITLILVMSWFGTMCLLYLAEMLPDIFYGVADEASQYASSSMQASLASAEEAADDNKHFLKFAAVVMLCLNVVLVAYIFYLRPKIAICIAICKESSQVVRDIPSMLSLPFYTVIAQLCFIFWVFLVGAWIVTYKEASYADLVVGAGEELSSNTTLDNLPDPGDARQFLGFYHLCGFLWIANWLNALLRLMVSGAGCYWFFFRESDYQLAPTFYSIYRSFRYHMGSAAFGSLIVAICQLLRLILAYITEKTKVLQEKNLAVKLLMKCVNCCMWCLEKTLKFITAMGYIYVALDGSSFCTACRNVFSLTMGNISQTIVIESVLGTINLISTCLTPLLVGFVSYNIINAMSIKNALYPTGFSMVAAFIISKCIAYVYETTVRTIFVCAMRDADESQGKNMSDQMKKAFGFDVEKAPEEEPLKAADEADEAAAAEEPAKESEGAEQ